MVGLEFSALLISPLSRGMLRQLTIQNLAVIDALDVEFQPGFNVLTGETGAGKSVLVEAVGLLMGDRASADLVRTGEAQAVVQAVFDRAGGGNLVVRREVTAQGRSRAFVDGTQVSATTLKETTTALLELHGQHEHQILLNPDSHLDLLDSYARLEDLRVMVATAFADWRERRDELARLQIDEREKTARLDLLRFQAGELQKAALRTGEDEELSAARRVLASAERLQRLCQETFATLYESDQGVLPQLAVIWRKVAELAAIDPQFQPFVELRDSVKGQLEDLAFFARDYASRIDASPARLQQIEDRLALLERLKRKYGPTLDHAITARDTFLAQIEAFEHAEERIGSLTTAVSQASEEFLRHARMLSRERAKAAVRFGVAMGQALSELAMEHASFEVRLEQPDMAATPNGTDQAWTDRGIDRAECYLSANPGEDPRPVVRIASGGELSRIMLAIKSLAAADRPGRATIFDEVDAGIGGRVADVVGRKLRSLGGGAQVLCITHLAQVAAHAGSHYRISKEVRRGRTLTRIARLDDAERVDELARMLGGAQVTEKARLIAKEMRELARNEGRAKGESERAKAKHPTKR
jgi:DNA repair protein RecN (Recombination protein N)